MTSTPTPSNLQPGSSSQANWLFPAGKRVRVTQRMPRQNGALATSVEGTVVRFEQSKTGSWFAHSKDDRLWMDRLILKRDDGEIVYLNLDQYSLIEAV